MVREYLNIDRINQVDVSYLYDKSKIKDLAITCIENNFNNYEQLHPYSINRIEFIMKEFDYPPTMIIKNEYRRSFTICGSVEEKEYDNY